MKALAFSAFIGRNIVDINTNRSKTLVCIYYTPIEEGEFSLYIGPIGNGPLNPAFIDSIIGAFRFTGTTIDTFFGYFDRHILLEF